LNLAPKHIHAPPALAVLLVANLAAPTPSRTSRDGAAGEPPDFTILTTAPGPDMAPYHDRLVAVLQPADWPAWINLARPEEDLLQPLPAGALHVETVRQGKSQIPEFRCVGRRWPDRAIKASTTVQAACLKRSSAKPNSCRKRTRAMGRSPSSTKATRRSACALAASVAMRPLASISLSSAWTASCALPPPTGYRSASGRHPTPLRSHMRYPQRRPGTSCRGPSPPGPAARPSILDAALSRI
jgi:hypothetical protein